MKCPHCNKEINPLDSLKAYLRDMLQINLEARDESLRKRPEKAVPPFFTNRIEELTSWIEALENIK